MADSTTGRDAAQGTGCGERLQKVLAAAGLGSRRECEELILEGRVEVDGQVASELGIRVDPLRQRVLVDGVPLPRPQREYYMVHKPPGVLSTNFDPSGRTRVVDLVRSAERLFTVGRLDRASEGLILVTNDGELANRLTHPRYGVEKVYRVRVAGCPAGDILRRLLRGVHLADGVARAAGVKVRRRQRQSTELEISLREGHNREIRRMLARLGHRVLWLKRIAIGPLRLGCLPVGAHRRLMHEEVRQLERAAGKAAEAARGAAGARGSRHGEGGQRPGLRGRRGPGPKKDSPGPEPVRPGSVLDAGFASPPGGRAGKKHSSRRASRR